MYFKMHSNVGELNGACEAALGNTSPQFMEVAPLKKCVDLRAIGFLITALLNSIQPSDFPHETRSKLRGYFGRERAALG